MPNGTRAEKRPAEVFRTGVMVLMVLVVTMIAVLAASASEARERRRDRQPQQITELDITGIDPETLRNAYIGTWNDQLGRFWFAINDIAGIQVRNAHFPLAHLKEGHIDGNQLTLVSLSCVPLLHCYSYHIEGKLISLSRMDIHGTDEAGETVHFVLTRK